MPGLREGFVGFKKAEVNVPHNSPTDLEKKAAYKGFQVTGDISEQEELSFLGDQMVPRHLRMGWRGGRQGR